MVGGLIGGTDGWWVDRLTGELTSGLTGWLTGGIDW